MALPSFAVPFPYAPMIRYGYPKLWKRVRMDDAGWALTGGGVGAKPPGVSYRTQDGMDMFMMINQGHAVNYAMWAKTLGPSLTTGKKLVRIRVMKSQLSSTMIFIQNVTTGLGVMTLYTTRNLNLVAGYYQAEPATANVGHHGGPSIIESLGDTEGTIDIWATTDSITTGDVLQIGVYPEADAPTQVTTAWYGDIEIYDGTDLLTPPARPGLGGWTIHGAGSVGATFAGSNGTLLDTLNDADAANITYWTYPVPTFPSRFGKKIVSFRAHKIMNSSQSLVVLNNGYSFGTGTVSLYVTITWDTTQVPVSVVATTGKVLNVMDMLDGSYEIQCETTHLNTLDQQSFYVYPVSQSAAATGANHFGDFRLYDQSSPCMLKLTNSSGLWTPMKSEVGGGSVSAAGVPESFLIRKDSLLKVPIRFHQDEWTEVEAWLDYQRANWSQPFDFYPNQLYAKRYSCYLHSPAPGTDYEIARVSGHQFIYELAVTLRSADTRKFNVKIQ